MRALQTSLPSITGRKKLMFSESVAHPFPLGLPSKTAAPIVVSRIVARTPPWTRAASDRWRGSRRSSEAHVPLPSRGHSIRRPTRSPKSFAAGLIIRQNTTIVPAVKLMIDSGSDLIGRFYARLEESRAPVPPPAARARRRGSCGGPGAGAARRLRPGLGGCWSRPVRSLQDELSELQSPPLHRDRGVRARGAQARPRLRRAVARPPRSRQAGHEREGGNGLSA